MHQAAAHTPARRSDGDRQILRASALVAMLLLTIPTASGAMEITLRELSSDTPPSDGSGIAALFDVTADCASLTLRQTGTTGPVQYNVQVSAPDGGFATFGSPQNIAYAPCAQGALAASAELTVYLDVESHIIAGTAVAFDVQVALESHAADEAQANATATIHAGVYPSWTSQGFPQELAPGRAGSHVAGNFVNLGNTPLQALVEAYSGSRRIDAWSFTIPSGGSHAFNETIQAPPGEILVLEAFAESPEQVPARPIEIAMFVVEPDGGFSMQGNEEIDRIGGALIIVGVLAVLGGAAVGAIWFARRTLK